MMGPDAKILVFWILSFKPTFLIFSLTFIKRLFSSSFSAIRMVTSAYMRLLIFLLAVFIPACAYPAQGFSWCSLHVSYISRLTIYSLDVLLFPIWNQSVVPCPVLTVASWPTYRFLKSPITSLKIDCVNNGNSDRFILGGLQNHCRWWQQPWN